MRRTLLVISIVCAMTTAAAAQAAPDLDELATQLELTDEQLTKLQELTQDAERQRKQLAAELRRTEADLRAALEADDADEGTVEALAEKLAKLEGETRAVRLVAWVRCKKVLNAKQRAALHQVRGGAGEPAQAGDPAQAGAPAQAKKVRAMISEYSDQGGSILIVVNRGSGAGIRTGWKGTIDTIPGSKLDVITVGPDETTCRVTGATFDQVGNSGRKVTLWP
jgi:Spy/CpxP family protein refolding chaperone